MPAGAVTRPASFKAIFQYLSLSYSGAMADTSLRQVGISELNIPPISRGKPLGLVE